MRLTHIEIVKKDGGVIATTLAEMAKILGCTEELVMFHIENVIAERETNGSGEPKR